MTGFYPAVEYMAFICVGIRSGRLDLSAHRVATRLAGGGALLAAGGVVGILGGAVPARRPAAPRDAAPSGLTAQQARNVILWDPDPTQHVVVAGRTRAVHRHAAADGARPRCGHGGARLLLAARPVRGARG